MRGVTCMPRPRKRRRVCGLPMSNLFGPQNQRNSFQEKPRILMSVEEYETIRLIDMEGLTQEECAEQMDVARTTIQRIYRNARKKLAFCLVDGNLLKIEGGDYQLCSDHNGNRLDCPHCPRRRPGTGTG